MTHRVVIAGAGLAGLRTAESLRTHGFADEVIIVGDEIHLPYNRPPLSKEALGAEGITHEALAFRHKPNVSDVDWRLGRQVTSSDLAATSVTLNDGEIIEADVIVAATGVRPRRLTLAGPTFTAATGHHIVRTIEDANALRADLQPGARLVVLGAGFIGCEVAATARKLGVDVTCAAYDPAPMLRPLGPELASYLQRFHETHGVAFRLGVGVTGLTGSDRVDGVDLADGSHLHADVVVEAVGSVCNTEWLAGQDLDLADGVLTDNALRPIGVGGPLDSVAVVGDLARYPNPLFDDVARRVEHWNIPTETGKRAGAVLAAKLAGDRGNYETVIANEFKPMPAFWSDQYDLRIQSFGLPGAATDVQLLEGSWEADEVVVGYLRDGVLMGVVGVGLLKSVMALRTMIGKPLEPVAN